jgi:hypothetical protein
MENQEASNLLLKKKYNLHNSPEVKEAAKRTQIHTGEKIPQDPLANIQNYLSRFGEITDRKDPMDREHGMDAAKRLLYSKFVIKPQEIPESYFENQQRLARELGHGDIDITQDVRHELAEVIVADQRSSLDKWVNYLTSADAPYSDGLKYFALRSVLSMGEYDKEKHAFGQRSKGTVKPFPDLNREALAYALDTIDKKYKGESTDTLELEDKDAQEFEKLIQGENFAKLYAWAIDKVTPASVEQLLNTRGQWVKYDQNSDATALVNSLQGHGTGWCTAAESTAETQLQAGDFYVYYSNNEAGKPTIPRAAIRMQEGSIVEVRGVAPEQNLDPYMGEVVGEKLKEFPDGQAYQKKAADMKRLTLVERKQAAGQNLTKDDLMFLYEVDLPIEGFGFQKDPRIEELQKTRDSEVDMPVIFDCEPTQIAHKVGEIGKNTRAYVGPLEKGIFKRLQDHNVEHVYTAFPEGKIRRDDVLLEAKTAQQYEQELTQDGANITTYALSMMRNPDFMTVKEPRKLDLVRLHVRDLGLKKSYPTTTEVYNRAEELGLDLCPPEVGPQYRLKYKDQPMNEWFSIGMKPIPDSGGRPGVFRLGHGRDGLWLHDRWAEPAYVWRPGPEFVFSLRK